MNHPSRFQVEYLILLEDHLKEMPFILETAVIKLKQISVDSGADFEWSEKIRDDLIYLKNKAKQLKGEAESSKQRVR